MEANKQLPEKDTEEENPVDVLKALLCDKKLYSELYPHQRDGILFLYNAYKNGKSKAEESRNGVILADEMGLGKSIQVIVFLHFMIMNTHKWKNALLVMPAGLLSDWKGKLENWTPDMNVLIYQNSEKELLIKLRQLQKTGGILLVSYKMFINHHETLTTYKGMPFIWDCLVFDEAHKLKNIATKNHKVAASISAGFHILMTGTPIQNNLKEYWSLVSLISDTCLLGTYKTFKNNFENPITKGMAADSRPEERALGMELQKALEKITEPILLRRRKDQIQDPSDHTPSERGLCLPKKNEYVVWIKLSPEQEAAYCNIVDDSSILTFQSIHYLIAVCTHPRLNSDIMAQEAREVHLAESGKLAFMLALLEMLTANGNFVLVFSNYIKILDIIQKALKQTPWGRNAFLRIDGQNPNQRDKIVNRFQKKRRENILLLTTSVGAEGLTLTAADSVVFADLSWNHSVDAQAVGRAHRIGQTKEVVTYRLITCGTLEETMYRRQLFKGSLTRQSMGDEQNPLRHFTQNELKTYLTLQQTQFSYTQNQLKKQGAKILNITEIFGEGISSLGAARVCGISDHGQLLSASQGEDLAVDMARMQIKETAKMCKQEIEAESHLTRQQTSEDLSVRKCVKKDKIRRKTQKAKTPGLPQKYKCFKTPFSGTRRKNLHISRPCLFESSDDSSNLSADVDISFCEKSSPATDLEQDVSTVAVPVNLSVYSDNSESELDSLENTLDSDISDSQSHKSSASSTMSEHSFSTSPEDSHVEKNGSSHLPESNTSKNIAKDTSMPYISLMQPNETDEFTDLEEDTNFKDPGIQNETVCTKTALSLNSDSYQDPPQISLLTQSASPCTAQKMILNQESSASSTMNPYSFSTSPEDTEKRGSSHLPEANTSENIAKDKSMPDISLMQPNETDDITDLKEEANSPGSNFKEPKIKTIPVISEQNEMTFYKTALNLNSDSYQDPSYTSPATPSASPCTAQKMIPNQESSASSTMNEYSFSTSPEDTEKSGSSHLPEANTSGNIATDKSMPDISLVQPNETDDITDLKEEANSPGANFKAPKIKKIPVIGEQKEMACDKTALNLNSDSYQGHPHISLFTPSASPCTAQNMILNQESSASSTMNEHSFSTSPEDTEKSGSSHLPEANTSENIATDKSMPDISLMQPNETDDITDLKEEANSPAANFKDPKIKTIPVISEQNVMTFDKTALNLNIDSYQDPSYTSPATPSAFHCRTQKTILNQESSASSTMNEHSFSTSPEDTEKSGSSHLPEANTSGNIAKDKYMPDISLMQPNETDDITDLKEEANSPGANFKDPKIKKIPVIGEQKEMACDKTALNLNSDSYQGHPHISLFTPSASPCTAQKMILNQESSASSTMNEHSFSTSSEDTEKSGSSHLPEANTSGNIATDKSMPDKSLMPPNETDAITDLKEEANSPGANFKAPKIKTIPVISEQNVMTFDKTALNLNIDFNQDLSYTSPATPSAFPCTAQKMILNQESSASSTMKEHSFSTSPEDTEKSGSSHLQEANTSRMILNQEDQKLQKASKDLGEVGNASVHCAHNSTPDNIELELGSMDNPSHTNSSDSHSYKSLASSTMGEHSFSASPEDNNIEIIGTSHLQEAKNNSVCTDTVSSVCKSMSDLSLVKSSDFGELKEEANPKGFKFMAQRDFQNQMNSEHEECVPVMPLNLNTLFSENSLQSTTPENSPELQRKEAQHQKSQEIQLSDSNCEDFKTDLRPNQVVPVLCDYSLTPSSISVCVTPSVGNGRCNSELKQLEECDELSVFKEKERPQDKIIRRVNTTESELFLSTNAFDMKPQKKLVIPKPQHRKMRRGSVCKSKRLSFSLTYRRHKKKLLKSMKNVVRNQATEDPQEKQLHSEDNDVSEANVSLILSGHIPALFSNKSTSPAPSGSCPKLTKETSPTQDIYKSFQFQCIKPFNDIPEGESVQPSRAVNVEHEERHHILTVDLSASYTQLNQVTESSYTGNCPKLQECSTANNSKRDDEDIELQSTSQDDFFSLSHTSLPDCEMSNGHTLNSFSSGHELMWKMYFSPGTQSTPRKESDIINFRYSAHAKPPKTLKRIDQAASFPLKTKTENCAVHESGQELKSNMDCCSISESQDDYFDCVEQALSPVSKTQSPSDLITTAKERDETRDSNNASQNSNSGVSEIHPEDIQDNGACTEFSKAPPADRNEGMLNKQNDTEKEKMPDIQNDVEDGIVEMFRLLHNF